MERGGQKLGKQPQVRTKRKNSVNKKRGRETKKLTKAGQRFLGADSEEKIRKEQRRHGKQESSSLCAKVDDAEKKLKKKKNRAKARTTESDPLEKLEPVR